MSLTQDIRDAFTRRDNALSQLIIINVLVFAVLVTLKAVFFIAQSDVFERVMRLFELSSDGAVLLRHPWTVLTYAFVQTNFWHILFNMLNLYWFGQLLREFLSDGNRRLVSIYVLGALAGAVVFVLAYNLLPVFRGSVGIPLIGASAAVTAIILAAATLRPDYTFVLFLFGPVKIKWIAAVVVVALSIEPIYTGNPGGGLAHLGGALLGFVFIKQLQAGRDLGAPVTAVGTWLGNLGRPRPAAMKVTHRRPTGSGQATPVSVAAAEEIDRILDKISRSGYESLSKEEKQRLFQASQQ